MINKATIILLVLLSFCSISSAKSNSRAFSKPGNSSAIKQLAASITGNSTRQAIWFSITKASTQRELAGHFINNSTIFTDDTRRGKDDGRTLMALNFALGLQSINSQNIRLPKIRVLLLQPLWKILSYGLAFIFLLSIAIVMTVNNITQKKLNQRLKQYEQQRALDLERQRISGELRDVVIADLLRITRISEMLDKPKTNSQLSEITQTGNKLIDNISEITWCVQPTNNTFNEFFPHLRESLYKMLKSTDIAFSILLPDNEGYTTLSIEQRRNILMSLKEIVYNAIKHSQAREIIVKAILMEKGLQFFISDNGIGFDPDKETNGAGIKTIQKQIADINGRLTLTSEARTGTYYTFFIPLRADYLLNG